MNKRYCACGKKIPQYFNICGECAKKYGTNHSDWPEWLRDWVKMYQSELDYERNNYHLEYIDEVLVERVGG